MTTEKEVAGCNIWRIDRMDNLHGFGSGNFLWRLFGIVHWCIGQMQTYASMGLSTSALT
jgi:hypothetical protein